MEIQNPFCAITTNNEIGCQCDAIISRDQTDLNAAAFANFLLHLEPLADRGMAVESAKGIAGPDCDAVLHAALSPARNSYAP